MKIDLDDTQSDVLVKGRTAYAEYQCRFRLVIVFVRLAVVVQWILHRSSSFL